MLGVVTPLGQHQMIQFKRGLLQNFVTHLNGLVLYEDTEYGNQFLSHLNKALQEVEVEVGIAYMIAIPPSVKD